jgi:hypothetical protein
MSSASCSFYSLPKNFDDLISSFYHLIIMYFVVELSLSIAVRNSGLLHFNYVTVFPMFISSRCLVTTEWLTVSERYMQYNNINASKVYICICENTDIL